MNPSDPRPIHKTKSMLFNPPTICDLCRKEFTKQTPIYDACMKSGQWAFLDQHCYEIYGVGLGLGRGQKYEWNEEKQTWLKTGG